MATSVNVRIKCLSLFEPNALLIIDIFIVSVAKVKVMKHFMRQHVLIKTCKIWIFIDLSIICIPEKRILCCRNIHEGYYCIKIIDICLLHALECLLLAKRRMLGVAPVTGTCGSQFLDFQDRSQ